MTISDEEFSKVINLITQRTGNQLRDSYIMGLRRYIERKPVFDIKNESDVEDIINEATVNETYFFREEKQFDALKDYFFPEWKKAHGLVPLKIWSAASSTGEEIYSIAAFAKYLGMNVELSASDINTAVLKKLESGYFMPKTGRHFDGDEYRNIISCYLKPDGSYEFPPEFSRSIKTMQVNLYDFAFAGKAFNHPAEQNLIFIRNVFIYFDRETRGRILKGIAERALATDGYLFVSISEVASFDADIIPSCLEKIRVAGIYCFHKKK